MLFYALMSVNPALNRLNEESKERKRGDYYDPETSIYNSKSEHDLCRTIINWDNVK